MGGLWAGMTAVVTGAAHGIGAAIATAGAREGGAVWLLDLDGAADDVARRIRSGGGRATALRLDVTDPAELDAAVRTILGTGGVDALVNCASRGSSADALSLTDDQWREVFDLDVTAAWRLTKALLPRMLDAGSGVVVNVGSLHATMTAERAFPYGPAKAALAAMTRSIALDFGSRGIRAVTVTPGWTLSERVAADLERMPAGEREALARRQPMRRFGRPDEVAEVAVFAASRRASFVTGVEWRVDGGLSARFA